MATTTPTAMASTPAAQPTLMEKLDVIPGLLSLLGSGLYHLITGPFRGERGANTLRHHIMHAIVRKMGVRLSTAQIKYIAGPFSQIYEKWCQGKGLTPNIVTLLSGAKAMWVGETTADSVVVYYHGGGFSLDGDDSHLNWWGANVQPELKAASKSVAFLFLEYTLVPQGTYPKQFQEAVEAVEYVVNDLKRSPSDVILAGDSAGGNMCLAVLSHILHPSPDVPKLEIDKPLGALILIAPWVSFRTDFPSNQRNAFKDIVTRSAADHWSSDYLAGQDGGVYAQALNADPSWWKDAKKKVGGILCLAGGDEVLVDSITEWVEKYKSVNGASSIEFVVGPHEIHIAPIVEPALGDSSPTIQGDAIKSWMKARL